MAQPRFLFDDFELDRRAYELRHRGGIVGLQRIPLELLFLLVENHGQLVTREEIIERIWGKETFSMLRRQLILRFAKSGVP